MHTDVSTTRNVVDVIQYLNDNPAAPAVSIYERLKPGILCAFPVDDMVLYAKNIKCGEIVKYMTPQYNGFPWEYIWVLIERDRALVE
jgi:hypothetical protein